MYELAMERLASAGYTHYEVSNWARHENGCVRADGSLEAVESTAGFSPALACRQNLLYWRNQEYLGIGPGAHSHLNMNSSGNSTISRRWGNHKSVAGYIRRIRHDESVVDFCEELSSAVSMGETMMLGLRLVREGVPFAHFLGLHGVELRQVFVGGTGTSSGDWACE